MKPLPWSPSSLDKFSTCPRQFYEQNVLKKYKQEKTTEIIWGEKVHKDLELRIKDKKELPTEIKFLEPYMQELEADVGTIYTEQKIALDTKLEPCSSFAVNVWFRGVIDFFKCTDNSAKLIDYKGLDIRTEIPTPTGFRLMQDLNVGDEVFDGKGNITTIVHKSKTKNLPCYKVTTTNNIEVICDDEHLWQTFRGVVPVTDLQIKDKILLTDSVAYRTQSLPLDPWVFGFWLADGKHTSSEIFKPDEYMWEEIQRRGYQLGKQYNGDNSCRSHSVLGIRDILKGLNVLGNKHIPDCYMYANDFQRKELIKGFFDGDGYANGYRNQAVINLTNLKLINQIAEILTSLGERINISPYIAKGFGKEVQAWMLTFRPRTFNPFSLPRKADVMAKVKAGRPYNEIKSIEIVDSVPTQCIGVSSPLKTYLCTRRYLPTHNTGKPHTKFRQLDIYAWYLFLTNKQLDEINAAYYWTKYQQETKKTYHRVQLPEIWNSLKPEIVAYRNAFKTDTWQPKPSGLCNGWCAVTDCEFWKPKR